MYKEEGNSAYKEKEFPRAVDFYTHGLETKCKDDELNAKLYSNRATAHFYMGRWMKMILVTFSLLRGGIQLGEGTRRLIDASEGDFDDQSKSRLEFNRIIIWNIL